MQILILALKEFARGRPVGGQPGGGWGGAEVYALALAERLMARGHSVSIASLDELTYQLFRTRCDGKVPLKQLSTRKTVEEITLFEWLWQFRSLDADLCIFSKPGFNAGTLRLDLAARLSFGCYVTIEHSTVEPLPLKASRRYLFGLASGIGFWWYKELWSRYSRSLGPRKVICVSLAVQMGLIKECRFPGRKVVAVHSGIDTARFRPDEARRIAMRESWNTREDTLVFGALGRFTKEKGYDIAIDSFRQLVTERPRRDIRLVLVGDGLEKETLEAAAKEIPIEHRVIFPGETDRPWEFYCAFDFILVPSLREGLGLTLIEAMACGCCPIAMEVGGIPEVITHSSLGWLVPGGDSLGFLNAMRRGIESSAEQRAEMGRRAREHIIANFDAQSQFLAIAGILESVWR